MKDFLGSLNPKKDLLEFIDGLFSAANSGLFERGNDNNHTELPQYELPDYLSFFPQGSLDNIFSDDLEDQIVDHLTDNISDLLKYCTPTNSVVITLAPTPYKNSGESLAVGDFIDEKNANLPFSPAYLSILYSSANDTSGLCKAFGWLKPVPLLKVLPPEVVDQCKLVLEQKRYLDDPAYLGREIRRAYKALQNLIKLSQENKKKA